jgi:hypothetical protein
LEISPGTAQPKTVLCPVALLPERANAGVGFLRQALRYPEKFQDFQLLHWSIQRAFV